MEPVSSITFRKHGRIWCVQRTGNEHVHASLTKGGRVLRGHPRKFHLSEVPSMEPRIITRRRRKYVG